VSCNNIYFSKLKLKGEDSSAVSNALESQNCEAHVGDSPVRNSAPIIQLLDAEVLLRNYGARPYIAS
jgi:hypothetical protein